MVFCTYSATTMVSRRWSAKCSRRRLACSRAGEQRDRSRRRELMDASDVGLIVGAVALVLVSGLLASAETAITRVSRVRVEELVRDGRRGATQLQRVLGD